MKKKLTPKQDALNRAAGFYLCDISEVDDLGNGYISTPTDEYKKLKKAQKNGEGERPAMIFAALWEEVDSCSVDSIVEMIENLRDEFLGFLKEHSK